MLIEQAKPTIKIAVTITLIGLHPLQLMLLFLKLPPQETNLLLQLIEHHQQLSRSIQGGCWLC